MLAPNIAPKKRWWLYINDKELAPYWFNFLEWVLFTGALAYLKDKTDNKWVDLFHNISVALLYLFVHSRVSGIINDLLDVEEIFVKNEKTRKFLNVLSAFISIIIVFWINDMVNSVITELQVHPI